MEIHILSECLMSIPTFFVSHAKLEALETRQQKASLLNQKHCLCPNHTQQKARAAPTSHLPPGCVTEQETGNYNVRLSHPLRWNVSLLLPTKSQTLLKASTPEKSETETRRKLYLLNKQVFWSYHMPVPVCTTEACQIFLLLLLVDLCPFVFRVYVRYPICHHISVTLSG